MRSCQAALLYAVPNDIKPMPFIHEGSKGTTDPRLQLGAAAVELDKRCTPLLFGGEKRLTQRVLGLDHIVPLEFNVEELQRVVVICVVEDD